MIQALEQLAELVRAEAGIELKGARLATLSSALESVAPGMSHAAVLSAVRERRTGASLRARLLEAVTVHETYFFRQRKDLDEIDWHALLAAARSSGSPRVRVWVAACSSGEEAHSLAILASEAFGRDNPPVSLLATDLSAAVLRRAEEGRYGGRSVRNVGDDLRERYFERDGKRLVVGERLRRLVELRQHNLVSDPPPGARFDLILCRNVLIYFRPRTVEPVLQSLEGALAPGGMLVLGAADRLCGTLAAGAHREGRAHARRPSLRRAPRGRDRERAPRGTERAAVDWAPGHARTALPPTSVEERMRRALAAADGGRLDEAVQATEAVLSGDPLNADAHFVRGVAELRRGNAAVAAESLRRALYVDPGFALAAFKLGRAHEALGDPAAARRGYMQALRTLAPGHERQERLVADIDLGDIAAACAARVASLG